jgi:hypothetical protein
MKLWQFRPAFIQLPTANGRERTRIYGSGTPAGMQALLGTPEFIITKVLKRMGTSRPRPEPKVDKGSEASQRVAAVGTSSRRWMGAG